MALIYVFFAIFFCWMWIEMFIFFGLKYNKINHNLNQLSVNKFKWFLRLVIIFLSTLIVFYMHLFENEVFQKTIRLCLNVLR